VRERLIVSWHWPGARALFYAFAMFLAAAQVSGAIIGTNPPDDPLIRERVDSLPRAERSAWKKYLKVSDRLKEADQDFLRRELKARGMKAPLPAPPGRLARGWFSKPDDWYRGAEARRIADIIVSFQTPAGGWSKNLDLTAHPRAPGEHFAPDNDSRFLGSADYDIPGCGHWGYVGTFDNDATTPQLRLLAKVISANPGRDSAKYQESFQRGLDYIFDAQYPNGGWPQVYPLQGGYHDAITYNDTAMINVMSLLRDISSGHGDFSFVSARVRSFAGERMQRGLGCILNSQITQGGRRTVWAQQHDPLTLAPASARNYEMPAQVSGESAGIMAFLMQMPAPSPEVRGAIGAAAAWFGKTMIRDMAFRRTGEEGRALIPDPGGPAMWARFYEIGSDRPLFGDRDKSIHDRVAEISKERRNGYTWYGGGPNKVLDQYRVWQTAQRAR